MKTMRSHIALIFALALTAPLLALTGKPTSTPARAWTPAQALAQSRSGFLIQITSDLAQDFNTPQISGNGEWVAYHQGYTGPLYLARSDGSQAPQYISDAVGSQFDISADGTIVYLHSHPQRIYLYKDGVTTDLTPCVSHTELGETCLNAYHSVAISGDGKWAYLNSYNHWPCVAIFRDGWEWDCENSYDPNNRNHVEVWRISTSGSGELQRISDIQSSAYNQGASHISADFLGSKVAFSCEACDDGGNYVYVVEGSGANQKKLAPIYVSEYGFIEHAQISGDGNWVLFPGNQSGQWGLDIIRSDGSDHRQLIRDDSEHGVPLYYDINYDGSHIAFYGLLWSISSCYNLNTFLIDNDGTDLRCAIGGLQERHSVSDLRFSHDEGMAFLSDDDLLGKGAADYKDQVFVYLPPVTKGVSTANSSIGQRFSYIVTLSHPETTDLSGSLTDPIPENTIYVPDSAWASKGDVSYEAAGNRITWAGTIAPGETVTVTFDVTATCSPEPPPPERVRNQAIATLGGDTYSPQALTAVNLPPKDMTTLADSPSHGAQNVYIESNGNGPLLQWHDQAGGLSCGAASTDDVAYRVYLRSRGGSWQEVGAYPNCSRQVQLGAADLSCQANGDPASYEWRVVAYDPEFVCREPVENLFSFTTASCRPEIEVQPAFALASAYFLDNQSVENKIKVLVDWNGPAYATPDTTPPYGSVSFDLNGEQVQVDGQLWGAEHTYDMGADFQSGFSCANNTLRIWATYPTQDGERLSLEDTLQPTVFAFPGWVDWLEDLGLGSFSTEEKAPLVVYTYEFSYPEEPFEATWNVPDVVPYLGGEELGILETQATADAEGQSNGAGSVGLSGQTGLGLGVLTSNGTLWGRGNVQFTCGESLDFTGAELGFSIHATVKKEISLVELIPGLKSAAKWPVVGRIIDWVTNAAKVTGSFGPGVDISTKFEERNGQLHFVGGEGTGGIDTRVTLSTEICEDLSASVYGGGTPYFTIQVPKDPSYLKEVGIDLYYGAAFTAWMFEGEYENVINCRYPPGECRQVEEEKLLTTVPTWGLIPRDYAGPEYGRLNAQLSLHAGRPIQVTETTTETTLIPVAYTRPEPVLAVRDDGRRLLAYVQDDIAKPHGRGTEIHLLAGDGTWNPAPFAVTDDQQPDFGPALAFDGSDHGLLVWQRSVLSTSIAPALDITFAQSLEIAYAVYTSTTESWAGPFTLTTNSLMDHAPHLATGNDGTVMALWQTNDGDDILGTAAHPLTLTYAIWDGAGWSAPKPALTGLQDVLDLSLASYSSTQAALVYVVDADGLLTSTTDTDLYYSTFDGLTWSSPAPITDVATLSDTTPALAYDDAGNVHLLWLHGGELAWLKNSWNIVDAETVRPSSTEGGFLGFTLDHGPDGNLGLIWQTMGSGGADLAYTLYDSSADAWGADQALTSDTDLETAHSPALGGDGKLYLAYQKVETEFVTATYQVSPTLAFTVTNIPTPGVSSLIFLEHTIHQDLAFDELTITPNNPGVGEGVTLTAILRNAGDLAIIAPQVAFDDGATQIGDTQTLPDLAAGHTSTVQMTWTVPSATAHTLRAVADPNGQVTEDDETNNEITLLTTLPDLQVDALYTQHAAGIITATARLINTGALAVSTPFTLAFRAADPLTGTLLGTSSVTATLDTTRPVTVSLPLTAPTPLTGTDNLLWAMADAEQAITEVIEDNNTGYAPLLTLPDLALTAADVIGNGPVIVSVHNVGVITATDSELSVWQGGLTGTLAYSGALGSIGPGASHSVTISLAEGETELWVKADPSNLVAEIDESNNLAVRQLQVYSNIYLPVVLKNH